MADKLAPPTPTGRLAGVDFGTVRVGLAITAPRRTIASPWLSYTRRNAELDAREFRRLAADEGVTLWVVGLPVHLSGQESQKSAEARRFGAWLSEVTGVPVTFFDERFSTREAEGYLAEGHLTRKRRKKRIDMLAAQVMLAAYLESSGGDSLQALDQ
jgi:putative holliday junction resolvase